MSNNIPKQVYVGNKYQSQQNQQNQNIKTDKFSQGNKKQDEEQKQQFDNFDFDFTNDKLGEIKFGNYEKINPTDQKEMDEIEQSQNLLDKNIDEMRNQMDKREADLLKFESKITNLEKLFENINKKFNDPESFQFANKSIKKQDLIQKNKSTSNYNQDNNNNQYNDNDDDENNINYESLLEEKFKQIDLKMEEDELNEGNQSDDNKYEIQLPKSDFQADIQKYLAEYKQKHDNGELQNFEANNEKDSQEYISTQNQSEVDQKNEKNEEYEIIEQNDKIDNENIDISLNIQNINSNQQQQLIQNIDSEVNQISEDDRQKLKEKIEKEDQIKLQQMKLQMADEIFKNKKKQSNVHANECQFQEYESGGVEIPITQKLGHKWYRFRWLLVCNTGIQLQISPNQNMNSKDNWDQHPISIATAPNNDKIELYIKDSGDWGHKLLQIAQQKNPVHKQDSLNKNQDQIQNETKKKQQQRPKDIQDKDDNEKQIKIYLGGPYGNPGVDLESLNYKIFLIIAGGIGVTPMLSTVQGLMDQVQRGRPIKKIYFIWSNKDEQLVSSIVSSQIEQSDKIQKENKQNQYLQQKLDNLNVGQKKSQIKNVNTLANNIDNSQQNNSILNEEFYLSQLNQLPNNNVLQEKNLLQVKNKLKVGKPQFDKIFDDIKKMAIDQNQRYVAVLSCGPQKLMNKVYEQCKINSDNQVDFYYHSEEFEF
ncbi:hypothetical protein PPERSA_06414 [Pseudocohnilembus persalinus]|uniref:Riboflavin synthase-like beta-barrel n=1 Tax=Pseudocohnilembus persalinus TaxID=266149 RepID=A0A0V0QRG6_PSEPJ|nr:hypothetical protein PPERSA_06414 [Pseudocohnilembus persalinus]|eukprot:KRX04780.1 hypothetical protein PPERSA_06414 [Pseudocohnilembus persalinus]